MYNLYLFFHDIVTDATFSDASVLDVITAKLATLPRAYKLRLRDNARAFADLVERSI